MILLYSWMDFCKKRKRNIWNPEYGGLLFFFPLSFRSLQKAIPQEQEIWNYNSAGDKWYVALLWIINESRRVLVLSSRPSVIQTVWLEQGTLARLVDTRTHTHAHTHAFCQLFSITCIRLLMNDHISADLELMITSCVTLSTEKDLSFFVKDLHCTLHHLRTP